MPANTNVRWVRSGPEGLATRAPWVWALSVGVYALVLLGLAIHDLRSYVDADVRSAGLVGAGLFVIVGLCAVGVVGCAVQAVPAARGRLQPTDLRRLGRLLRGCGGVLGAVVVVSGFLSFLPVRGATAEALDQAPVLAAAALLPAILLLGFGRAGERAFEVFAKGRR
ncbi:hypothetical protein [Actinopolymorpha pittospori]